jgi:hypothetical protein
VTRRGGGRNERNQRQDGACRKRCRFGLRAAARRRRRSSAAHRLPGVSEGGLPRHEVTVGELFPADDVVAQWVFSVTSLAEDLMIITPLLRRDDMRERMWFYRQLITRLLEARRLVRAHEEHPEITEFTAPNGLKLGPVDLAAAYARPSDHERSAVEKLYADSRNRSVHYSEVGEPELRGLLHDYRWMPATMVTSDRGEDGARLQIEYGWVTGIRGQDVWGAEPWAPGMVEHLGRFGQQTGALSSTWIMLSFVLLVLHAHRMGIPLERIVDNPERVGAVVQLARERSGGDSD